MRLAYTAVQPPCTYTFAMNCAMSEGNDTHQNESFVALCRHFWNFVSFDFGLCNAPATADPELLTWQQISDEFYQYAFEIPEQWVQTGGVSPDSFTYVSEAPQPPSCVQSDNTMKMDFLVQPVGNGMPDIEGATPVTDAELPTWVKTHESNEGGDLPGASKSIYIQGSDYEYSLYLLCSPEWMIYCEVVINHILESFHTLP
ncbi:MAG: hypothetical protein D8M54_06505 [Chloroflexi bacterium]|nr:hypothetical protein [Chloroflexota bacterium]